DIGETSNKPTQVKRNEFEELSASANEELYTGCDFVTRLDFMVKFTHFKVKDIIDVNEDDDFIDDEDVVPHDLVDSNTEVLANDDDDDDVAVVYSSKNED
nr:hypothetical protein [Tanacetum cinerariifolium]